MTSMFQHAKGTDDPRAGMWEFEGLVKLYTAKAVLFEDQRSGKSIWLPRSKVIVDDDGESGKAFVSIPDWLAREKELVR